MFPGEDWKFGRMIWKVWRSLKNWIDREFQVVWSYSVWFDKIEFAWKRELWNILTAISAVTHILEKQIAKFRKLHKDNSLYNKRNMTLRIYRKFDTFETLIKQIFKERINSQRIGRIVFNKVFQSRTDKFAFNMDNAYYCLMFHETTTNVRSKRSMFLREMLPELNIRVENKEDNWYYPGSKKRS